MYWGPYWGMHMFWWIFWAIAITVFVLWAIRSAAEDRPLDRTHRDDAVDVLRRAYAAGELAEDEYRRRLAVLDETRSGTERRTIEKAGRRRGMPEPGTPAQTPG